MNESISTRRTKEREDLNEQAGRNWLVTIARAHLSLNLQQLRKTISQVPELQIQIGGTRSRGHEHTQWRHGSQQGGGASFWQHALLVRRRHYILAANAPCKVATLAPCPRRRREARDGRWRWDTRCSGVRLENGWAHAVGLAAVKWGTIWLARMGTAYLAVSRAKPNDLSSFSDTWWYVYHAISPYRYRYGASLANQ